MKQESLEPRVCPDCAAEGNKQPQPPEAFYVLKRKKKDGVYLFLSTYCKRHQSARNTSRNAARLATSEQAREKKRAAYKRYVERHRAQRVAYLRDWRARNPERTAEHYQANRRWVERNPEKRRDSQRAWYQRKKKQAETDTER